MLVEINKETITNQDVRSAILTLRKNGMYTMNDGYYDGYLTEKQVDSLLNDPAIVNVFDYGLSSNPQNPLINNNEMPAIYGCKFFRIMHENQPARFYGRHSTEEVELVEVNP